MSESKVFWHHGRVFILCKEGPKYRTGLVIEADGVYSMRVPARDNLKQVEFHGRPYPNRKMRGHLRKLKAQTKGAQALRSALLQ
jgi:hypothetical protein